METIDRLKKELVVLERNVKVVTAMLEGYTLIQIEKMYPEAHLHIVYTYLTEKELLVKLDQIKGTISTHKSEIQRIKNMNDPDYVDPIIRLLEQA